MFERLKRNKGMIIFPLITLGLALFILFVSYDSTQSHEIAHQKINEYFGVDSHIEVNMFGTSHTHLDENFYSPEDRRAAYLGHAMNEAVGYQLRPFLMGIMILLMVLISIGLFLAMELWEGLYGR